MYKDLKSFKNYASLDTKGPFTSFRETICKNYLSTVLEYYTWIFCTGVSQLFP